MVIEKIDKKEFEDNYRPSFENMTVVINRPFYIKPMKEIKDYENAFDLLFHGILYNFFIKIENKNWLSFEEYKDLYKSCITTEVFNGETTLFYGDEEVLVISDYYDDTLLKNGVYEYLTPVYKDSIKKAENDVFEFKSFEISREKDEEMIEEIKAKSSQFMQSKRTISFEEFDNFEELARA